MSAGTVEARRGSLLLLSGLLFVAFFVVGLVLGGVLATSPLPMPDAPPALTARYYEDSGTAVLAASLFQALSAVALFVFTLCVTTFVRRTASGGGTLSWLVLGGGASAAGFLLLSVVFSGVLALAVPGGDLGLTGSLRDLNFLTGGTIHVAALGLFVGASSISAREAEVFARWISWLGLLAAMLSLLSLASLAWYPANFLIPLGRLLAFVWSVAVGIVLVRGGPREPDANSLPEEER